MKQNIFNDNVFYDKVTENFFSFFFFLIAPQNLFG